MFRVETGLAPSPHAASTETRQAASLQEIRGALICAGSHLVSAEDILSQPQPPPDVRVAYGADPNQFLEVRLPRTKGPHSVLLNVHGGYRRPKYDLAHAGHLCEALRGAGIATFNIEYRRVGNAGLVLRQRLECTLKAVNEVAFEEGHVLPGMYTSGCCFR